ncbi:endoribonuclease L-PSP [mine drainage metagenome]|uniref:Endoribonuclease L-PSP n=1 Tax=mine drainage metagenome TaxID=410659 RepID=T1BTV8_9ZZZZ
MTERVSLTSAKAPRAIGPYSPAVRAGSWVFISGQIGLDPQRGELVPGGFRAQAEQALRNLVALCGTAGECAEVVKLTVYLVQMSDYPVLNELMETLWQPPYPARAVVGVRELPRGALIEVEAVLFI